MGAGGGGNEEINGTDGTSLTGQVGAYLSCFFGATVVKGQALQGVEETLQKLQVGLDSLAATRTIEQFHLDDAAQNDLFGGVLQEMVLDLRRAVVEQLDT